MDFLVLSFLSVFLIIITLIALAYTVNIFFASALYKGKISENFDGKRFYNIGWKAGETFRLTQTEEEFLGKKHKNGFLTFYRWILNQKISFWKKRPIKPSIPPDIHTGDTVRITYVGHATVLIQIAGLNILTDPVWSTRASPVEWIGPRRYTEPGINFEHLPKIDIVLLSHNHYDHMDVATLRKLSEKYNPTIYTGLGNKSYLAKRKIHTVIEMDWWHTEHNENTDIKITFLPSQHFSARGITDRNRTLWGGFALEIQGKSLYFAGDTGMWPYIGKIKDTFPNGFDIGLLPIGAYNPRWFMAAMHTSPHEAMEMQKSLGIKQALGIHYGTFPLAGDLQDEPAEDLERAKNMDAYRGQIFEIGPSGSTWEW